MNITLNGKTKTLEGEQPVSDLLSSLSINPAQVAVAVNGDVIPKRDWTETTVRNGDVVEVVRAVGGGAI
jgi:sulfur carrier protein